MTYIDGFVFVVPKKNIKAYTQMAKDASKVWKKHGALDYKECMGDDLQIKNVLSFTKLAKIKPSESVWFSFIVYKSRAHRDSVNKKVMAVFEKDPKYQNMPMPFDMKKMAYGGFKTIVE